MKNPSVLAKEFMEHGRMESEFIIDNHTHMGEFYGLSLPNGPVECMLKSMDKNHVKYILSAPNSALFDPCRKNADIEKVMKTYGERILGYYSFNPNFPDDMEEIDRAFRENPGYVGFKILPDYHCTMLTDKRYQRVFEYADKNHKLILSHTWGRAMDGISYSSMDMVSQVVETYPNLIFIMGHSAQGECDAAIAVAEKYENAYLELTDTYRLNGMLEKMCHRAGSHKVLFGTDLPWYDPAYAIGCILFADISDDDKRNILNRNSLRILKGKLPFKEGENI